MLSLPAGAALAAAGPTGQFLPSAADRDGDGLTDAADCAADDPSRPARGADADCDGVRDEGAIVVDVAGPAPDLEAASAPSRGTPATRAVARRAAGGPVVLVRGLPLGPSVAVYAPARPRAGRPTVVVVARTNAGVTVRPRLLGRDGAVRSLPARSRSLPRGRALVVGPRVDPAATRRVRFAITVVDPQGARHRATQAANVPDPAS